MSWKDKEIDKLFQDNSASNSFEYKNEYWEEFEASLPVNNPKGGDFLWMTTAVLFLGIVTTMSVMNQNGANTSFDGTILFAATNPATVDSVSYEEQAMQSSLRGDVDGRTNNEINDTRSIHGAANPSSNGLQPNLSAAIIPVAPGERMSVEPLASNPNLKEVDPVSANANSNGIIPNSSNRTMGKSVDNAINKLALRALIFEDDRSILLGLPVLTMAPIQKRAATLFYLELNGGLSESIVSPSDQYSNSLGAGFGVEIQKANFNFTGGINAIISNHNDIQLNRNTVIYGYGSEAVSTYLNYRQIYSLEANLSVGYSIGKHVVTIGIRPSYVVGSKVQDRRVIENELIYDIQGYGYMDGLKRVGLKPQIGYAYKFTHGFTLGANIGIQTRRALNEDFINGENNAFPIDGQVYLRKTIFGKSKKIRK